MRLTAVKFATAIVLLALLPFAALSVRAADEPEIVYGKFHRAAMAGDLEEMLKYGPAIRRAEYQVMSASSKEAAIKMTQFMMPRAFTLQRKTLHSNGKATLIVSGPWAREDQRLETMYGVVRMMTEGGEWKVDESNWSNEKPAILATPKPGATPAVAEKAAAKPGAVAKGAANPAQAQTAPVLGKAKPPCVYKAVMTAEDVENCK